MAFQHSFWKTKPVESWTEQDVSDWIGSLGASLKPLQSNFVGIDGTQLLSISLDCRIHNSLQRKIFKKKLNAIKQQNEVNKNNNSDSKLSLIQSRLSLMGLQNQGNTCYLNSAIQALLQTPKLTHYFRKAKIHSIGYNSSMLHEWVKICQYAIKHSNNSYRPSAIYKKVVQSHNSYSFGSQDDAFFALTSIIGQLDDEINDNNYGPSRYIMSKSSTSKPLNKCEIIEQFEFQQNPMQSNIVRCLMDGIKATKRTCLECTKYWNIIYESQRTVSLPLISNKTKLKMLLLIDNKQFIFHTSDVMSYASINVLKYYIQQHIFNETKGNVKIELQNIEIAQIVKSEYTLRNTKRLIHFFKPNDKCSELNATTFAICKLKQNKLDDRDVLVLSMIYDIDKYNIMNNKLDYGFETISIGDKKITGELIMQKIDKISSEFNQDKEQILHSVCFYENEIIQKYSFYNLNPDINVFINVLLPKPYKDSPEQVTKTEYITQVISNNIHNFAICQLVELDARKGLNGKLVEVLFYESKEERWKCEEFNKSQIRKYIGVKENNLRKIMNVKINFDILNRLFKTYIQYDMNKKEILLTDINECINIITKTEIHDNNSCSLKCEFCNKYSTLIKQEIEIIKEPQILIFNLERAIRDNNERQYSNYWQKKTHLVNFNVNNFKYGESEYDLYGVCNHHGSSTSYGHYTAYVKTIDDNRWFIANDSQTNPMVETNVVTSGALMLMYKKK
eukprot:350127_1